MVAHVVIDTDVCSFLLKGDSRVQIYRPHLIANRHSSGYRSTHATPSAVVTQSRSSVESVGSRL